MTKQYMIMNKQENRVLLSGYDNLSVFSGEIGNYFVNSFNPMIFKSKFSAILRRFLNISCKIVSVQTNDNFTMPVTEYMWLKFKDETKSTSVIKVYGEDCGYAPPNSSKIYHSGKVKIEGFGDYVWSDFVEIIF